MADRRCDTAARLPGADTIWRNWPAPRTALCAAAFAAAALLGACEAEAPRADRLVPLECGSYERTPVLFVHGSGLTSDSFETMIDAFLDDAYPPDYLLAIDMTPRDGDNVRAAERFVARGTDRLLAASRAALSASSCDATPPSRIDIVAHSMGSFSSRWFARFVAPEKLRTLVSLAGANHGTDSLCGRPGPGDRQMCPAFAEDSDDSDVQVRLNGSPSAPTDETAFGIGEDPPGSLRIPPDDRRRIAFFSIRLDPDRWIAPADSAVLEGAGGRAIDNLSRYPVAETSAGNFLFTDSASHDGLPYHPRLVQFVLDLLSAADD